MEYLFNAFRCEKHSILFTLFIEWLGYQLEKAILYTVATLVISWHLNKQKKTRADSKLKPWV